MPAAEDVDAAATEREAATYLASHGVPALVESIALSLAQRRPPIEVCPLRAQALAKQSQRPHRSSHSP